MERSCSFDVDVTAADVDAFSQLSGDRNPLHTSAEYARSTDYGQPIVHGAFLVALVSRVLGMHIPGERSVILSLSVRFPKPLFYPARVQVTGTLSISTRSAAPARCTSRSPIRRDDGPCSNRRCCSDFTR